MEHTQELVVIYSIVSTVNLVDLAFLMKMECIISNMRSAEMLSILGTAVIHRRFRRRSPG